MHIKPGLTITNKASINTQPNEQVKTAGSSIRSVAKISNPNATECFPAFEPISYPMIMLSDPATDPATECFPAFEPISSPRGMLSFRPFRPDSYPVDRQNAIRNSLEIEHSTDDKAQLLPPPILYPTSDRHHPTSMTGVPYSKTLSEYTQ